MNKLSLVVLLFLSSLSFASLTPEQAVEKIKKSCGADMEKFCGHIQNKISSEGNTCLIEHKKELSAECAKNLHELKIYLQGSMKR